MIDVQEFTPPYGRSPFQSWVEDPDARAALYVVLALSHTERRDVSNVKGMGGGTLELQTGYSPGYRVYFGERWWTLGHSPGRRDPKAAEPTLCLRSGRMHLLTGGRGDGNRHAHPIVSPDDVERDTVIKRADYAEAGIPEYWLVTQMRKPSRSCSSREALTRPTESSAAVRQPRLPCCRALP
jgi:putative component of toxin-antitoxin plasmid stabilization module